MARYLLLAEKPSVMRDIEEVYKKNRSDFNFDMDFGAFHGHLMELAQPADYNPDFQKWTLDDLPIIPDPFVYVEKDPESCKKLMARIKAGHYDALINACDAGREGEHIFFSFYEAHGLNVPVLRFWASDTTEITICKALKDLQPAQLYDGLRQSAKLRAQLDWLSGINFSRAVSLKTGKKANIGRVVSPTLKIIVDREHEIVNFKPQDFFEVQAAFSTAAGKYAGVYMLPPDYKKSRFDKKADAENLMNSLPTTGTIKEVISKQKAIKAPTLYSITELQKDGARYFGYGADKTEAIAQSLYEKHLTSYPRTESRFLPTAMIPELMAHLKPLSATPLQAYAAKITQSDIDRVTKTKDYIDNKKITDHHAIIPTTDLCKDFNALTKDEQNIYLMVCKRFLSIFMPPYVVENTTIWTDLNGNLFKSTGKVEVDKGYSVLYTNKSKDVVLPSVKKGDFVTVAAKKMKEGKTTPPDRFNTATLLDAMKNAGNLLTNEESRKVLREAAGLGTGATRKDILKKLETTKMCEVKKTVFYPTEFGCTLIDVIGDRSICSPQMTADWETKLQKVEDGTYSGNLSDDIQSFIQKETADIVTNINQDMSAFRHETIGICPKCGKPVYEGKNYYLCSEYKKSCDFIVCKNTTGTTITKADLKLLLAGKPTKKKKMKTKTGKEFSDVLLLDENFRLVPGFTKGGSGLHDEEKLDVDALSQVKTLGKCPCCGGKIYEGKNFYLCTGRADGKCSWTMSKMIRSTAITPEDVTDILSGKTTKPHQFTWASGKNGHARLKLNGAKLEFVFDN